MKHRLLAACGLLAGLVLVVSACTTAPAGGGGGPANTPPTAIMIASPTTGSAPLVVSFDATSSVDPGGTIINYFWDFGDGTSANGGTVDHTYAPGTWTAQLLVTDNQGAVSTDSVTITATNVPPTAAFTATSTTGPAPLAVTLDASSSVDLDGSITSYAWDFEELGTGTGQTINKTFPAGSVVVTLTVTDNNGVTASTTGTITGTGAPAAPSGLRRTGQGCCDTYGDFAWNIVPGADGYEISMDGFFGGGCLTDHSDVINGQVSSGRVQAVGLCLGSQYDVSIRARANGVWGPWSGSIRITL